MLSPLISLLAPHCCLACGNEGSLLCEWCRPEILEPVPPRCYRCKKVSDDFRTCKSCRGTSKLHRVWVASEYSKGVKRLIQAYKFERAVAGVAPIAEAMLGQLPYFDSKDTLVVHVPTATRRRRQRGYDHAELLAKAVAKANGLRYVSLLSRHGQSRQVGSTREIRLSQLAEAFRVRKPSVAKGAQVLLIDDITTTGATLETAAALLRTAGVKRVDAAVFAQR